MDVAAERLKCGLLIDDIKFLRQIMGRSFTAWEHSKQRSDCWGIRCCLSGEFCGVAGHDQMMGWCTERRIQIVLFIGIKLDDRRVQLNSAFQQAVTLHLGKQPVFRKLRRKFSLIDTDHNGCFRAVWTHTVCTSDRYLIESVWNRADITAECCHQKQLSMLLQRKRDFLQHMGKHIQKLHQNIPCAGV